MEIIPNWHPILVHFTVALLSISALLYLAAYVFKKEKLLIAARLNLWIGAAITLGTLAAGLYAYYTVAHDALSHSAMTDHRNWAFVTTGFIVIIALWSIWKHRDAKTIGLPFVLIFLTATAILGVTAYKGAEVVYRHGTGVMRMPEVHGDGGHSSHSHGENSHETKEMPSDMHEEHGSHAH
ncbi:MAG: hypothetical protein CMH30_04615 [Micavibrio sp.]|nr:hypothetical protein [Micavibrio sp.]|tara:strand:+ start:958 stop:1500 length:543 start_codon:yes stop_codon:yes gene_type:complete